MTSIELCPNCHASIALTSHKLSFGEDFTRAFHQPTQSEVSRVERSMTNLSNEMADLVQKIVHIESVLIAFKAHLDTQIQRITQYIHPSPIRQLPTEVLDIIFASACASFQRSEYKTPLSISLVCSKWRDIALSTPLLWTHIYIAPQSGGLDVYNHFLEQCGSIPISVKVDIPHRYRSPAFSDGKIPYEETYNYHLELLSAISQNCAQWQVAKLCMNQEDINLLGSVIHPLDFPVLESLTLMNDGPSNFLEPGLFKHASSSTNLAVLDREGHQVGCRFYVNALPWSQLGEICLQSDVYSLRLHLKELEDGHTRTLILKPHLHYISLPLNVQFSFRVSSIPSSGRIHYQTFSNVSPSPPSRASL